MEKRDALDILRELVGMARECEACEGTGEHPHNPDDACHSCGGVGEVVDSAGGLLGDARAAIAAGSRPGANSSLEEALNSGDGTYRP